MGSHAVRGGVRGKEDVVGAGALRAVRGTRDERGLARAGLAQRHGGGAAAVETECAHTAKLLEFLAELRRSQAGADRGLVAVDLVQDDRAVALDADGAARAARGRGIDAGGRDRAVVNEQLAADGIFDLAPCRVCGGDGERDLLTDREIDPRGNVRAVGFGEYHLVLTDGEGGRAGSLAHDLELDRAAGLDRGGVLALEHDIAALGGEMGRLVVVAVEQVRTGGRARFVEVGDRAGAACARDADAHRRAADDGGAVLLEADGVLPCIGGDERSLVDDQTDGDAARHDEKVGVRAADNGLALVLQVFDGVRDGGLAAVDRVAGVDHDGGDAGVRLVCQHVCALHTGGVFALGARVGQPFADRIGPAEAVGECSRRRSGEQLRHGERRSGKPEGGFTFHSHIIPRVSAWKK